MRQLSRIGPGAGAGGRMGSGRNKNRYCAQTEETVPLFTSVSVSSRGQAEPDLGHSTATDTTRARPVREH